MALSQPKSYNYKEVLLICHPYVIKFTDAITICDTNKLHLSQDPDEGDDYINTADLNIYGNIWKTNKKRRRKKASN